MQWLILVLLVSFCKANDDLEPLYMEAGYTVEYFSQQLDHINGDPGLINIKVLLRQGSPTGPLFVYTGNEGPIEEFFEMTGWLVYTLGPYYNATVAFIEHRYYGDSVPVEPNFAYLNTDQTLLDFAGIITQLKPSELTPVVAFGGSYGGMLSAYFRIKFPYLVDGAIASSGPVLEYLDEAGMGLMHTATQTYYDVSPNCAFSINEAFNILDNFAQNEYTWPGLSALFSTCTPITQQSEVLAIETWIANALETYAQLNYPYPTQEAGGLPGFPVNVSCSIMAFWTAPAQNMWKTLQGIAEVAELLYNNTGTETCFSPWSTGTDPVTLAWLYQTCSELIMPQGTYGLPNDMFNVEPFTLSDYSAFCNQTYGVTPNPHWYPLNYGFNEFYMYGLRNLSNVVFSYGTEDPWQSGCLHETPNDNVLVYGIYGGAHHAELRQPNANDPQSVRLARRVEQKQIEQWIGWSS